MIDLVLSLFFFFTALLGLAMAAVRLLSKKEPANFFFGLFVGSLAVVSIYNFYVSAATFKDFPKIFIITKSFIFVAVPSAFLFVRGTLFPETEFKKYEWIHFLPFLICLSMTILLSTGYNSSNLLMKYITLISSGTFSILSVTLWLTYSICQTMMIFNYDREGFKANHYHKQHVLNWLETYNLTLLFLFSLLFTRPLLLSSAAAADGSLYNISISSVLIYTSTWLYFNPQIMEIQKHNSPAMTASLLTVQATACSTDKEIIKPFLVDKKLNRERRQEISSKLDTAFSLKKLFLKKSLAIRDLSEETDISIHELSNFINSEFNLRFQDYINLKRIVYFTEMAHQPKWKDFPLEAMISASGFTSRTTCCRAFIKHTGESPSQYLKKTTLKLVYLK